LDGQDGTGQGLAKFCENNSKLGKGAISFDMSPIRACPGSAHAICRELRPDGKADPKPICWACRKKYGQEKNKGRLLDIYDGTWWEMTVCDSSTPPNRRRRVEQSIPTYVNAR